MPSVDSQRFVQLFQRTLEKGGKLSSADLSALKRAGESVKGTQEKAAVDGILSFIKHDRELDAFETAPVKKALEVLVGVSTGRLPRDLEKVLTHAVPAANAKVKAYELSFDFSKDGEAFPARAVVTLEKKAAASTILEVDTERLTIKDVKVGGKKVPFTLKDGRVTIEAKGASAIEFNYTVKPQDVRGNAETAYGLIRDKYSGRMWTLTWPYNTGALFPSNSAPSDGSTAKVTVKVGAEHGALATGTQQGKSNTFVSKAEAPAYAVALYTSKDFELGHGGHSHDGVEVTSYGAGNSAPEKSREAYRKATVDALDFFSKWLGNYDYGPTLKLVELAGGLGGMEHTAAVAIMLNSARDPESARETAVHETAHHWFGDNIRIANWGDFWMSEGFTNYATYRFFEAKEGKDKLYQLLDRAKGEVRGALADNPHALSAPEHTDVNEIFDSIPYEFGPWMLRMVEKQLGTEKFDPMLKEWFGTHRQTDVSTKEFVDFVKSRTGTDFTAFFKEWNNITAVPKLDAEVKLTGKTAQVELKGKRLPGDLAIPLVLEGEGGKTMTVKVKPGDKVKLEADFEVKKVRWDPERTVLADVT
jgi:aminopeptidase N